MMVVRLDTVSVASLKHNFLHPSRTTTSFGLSTSLLPSILIHAQGGDFTFKCTICSRPPVLVCLFLTLHLVCAYICPRQTMPKLG